MKKYKKNMIFRGLAKSAGSKLQKGFYFEDSMYLSRVICNKNANYVGALLCGDITYYIFKDFIFCLDNVAKSIIFLDSSSIVNEDNYNRFPYVDVFGKYKITCCFNNVEVTELTDYICGLPLDRYLFRHILIFDTCVIFFESVNIYIIGHEYKTIEAMSVLERVRWLHWFIEKNSINFKKMKFDYDTNRFKKSPLTRFRVWLHKIINKLEE